MLREWPMLTANIGLTGQSNVHVLNMYIPSALNSCWNYNHYIPLLLMKSPPTLSTACHWWKFKYCTSTSLDNISILNGILVTLTMALHMSNDHIRYCHMDATQLVGLAWSYFSHPDYLFMPYLVHTMDLFPDSIIQTGPCVHHFVKFFSGDVLHTWASHLYCAVLDHSIVTQPFVVTTYPPLEMVNHS